MRYGKIVPAAAVCLTALTMLFSPSCANTTEAPTGGPKDTIPPVIRNISPLPGAVGVPVHGTKIVFTFDEYVTVKDGKSIFLSPPQEKAPKYKLRGKSLIVYFEEDLEENTTYTLDITNAIADNNEGNMFPGFSLVFSTGEAIDSMLITGTVQDCNTLQPLKGATVMLYKDSADSAIFLHRPNAAVKTDEWGFFCIRNIQDTLYRLYAIVDENGNNIYDPDNDKIAFVDTAIRPSTVVRDSLPELLKYDMKDTLNCLARKSEYELNVFRETPSKQMIVNKERVDERSCYITFMAHDARIDSMWIKGIPSNRIITQFNRERDSLEIWVNDRRRMPDTLRIFTKYWKTDTTGVLKAVTEEAKLLNPKRSAASKSSRRDIKHEDTTCVVKLSAAPETVEQYGFEMEFKYPPISGYFDSLRFKIVNPKQKESYGKYTVERDSLNLRKYIIRPKDKLLEGYEYYLKVPHRKFRDINGWYNDSTEVKVALPTDEKLSSINFIMSGVNTRYIVDLLNEKRDRVIRSFIVDSDQTVVFPYLKAGKYSIRLTEDTNRNGMVDTGCVLEHRQPEKVKFFKVEDAFQIDVPERAEIDQEVNVAELFKD